MKKLIALFVILVTVSSCVAINPVTDLYRHELRFVKLLGEHVPAYSVILKDTTRLMFKWGVSSQTMPYAEQPVPFWYPANQLEGTEVSIKVLNSEVVYADSVGDVRNASSVKSLVGFSEGYYALYLASSLYYNAEVWSQYCSPVILLFEKSQDPPYLPVFYQVIQIK